MILSSYGDLALSLGREIRNKGYELLFLSVIMQAAEEKDSKRDYATEDCISASDFINDVNTERIYYGLYGIRELPKLFIEKYRRVKNE